MAEPASDSFRAARESDFRRMLRQVAAIAHTQRGIEERVLALEAAIEDARADMIVARQVDEALGESIDRMLSDVAAGR